MHAENNDYCTYGGLMNWKGLKTSNPLKRPPPWDHKTSYFVVDASLTAIWLARILSPGSWWGALFSYQGTDGRFYPKAGPMEVYLVMVLLFGFVSGVTSWLSCYPMTVTVISAVLLLEIAMYHFWIMLIRPRIDQNYIQYSGIRTVILTFLAFMNTVNLYSAIYLHAFSESFSPQVTPWLAWAYSTGEITGSGYSGISANASPALAFVSGSEKLLGVLFLAIIISLSLEKLSGAEIGQGRKGFEAKED